MQSITTVQTDDQDTKKQQQYKQRIRIQNITTVLTDDQDTTPNNNINREPGCKT